jgi:hypothetical protein
MSTTTDRERFEKLMMGALDGELTAAEEQEFENMLASDSELKKEFHQYKKLKKATTTMKFKAPPPEVWDNYWLGVYNKMERGIGWLIFTIGAVILLTYGGFKTVEAVINDPGLAFIVKVGILLTIGGLAVLFVSVAREKFFTRKHDPYKEIIR